MFGILFIWDVILLFHKVKKDNGLLPQIMCGVAVVLFVSAIMIVLGDITEIASSIVILVGILIVLYVPYSKKKKLPNK